MKNSNLLNRLCTDSHEKQSPQRFARYAAMLIFLLTLGVGQMWAWNTLYYAGSDNSWNGVAMVNNDNGKGYSYRYIEDGTYFKIKHNNSTWLGVDEGTKLAPGGTGVHFDKAKTGENQRAEYDGDNGIVLFQYNQIEAEGNADDYPWVWITRPTIYLKNSWNAEDWTWKACTDKGDGTYYIDNVYGASGVNFGTDGTSAWQYWNGSSNVDYYISCTPDPSDMQGGAKCRYSLNASAFNTGVENMTLTITAIYTCTFNLQEKGDSFTQDILKNTKASTPSVPTATGYEFGGWYTDEDCTSAYNFNSLVTSDFTLYAKWTEKSYSLTFTNDGHGSVAVGGEAVASGSTATVNHHTTKTLVATNNTGYHFNNWTLSGSNTGSVTIGSTTTASTTIKTSATGATVRANFLPNTYTVTLDKNGGSSNGSATATYDSNTLTSLVTPSKTGYHVEGYYESNGSSTWGDKVATDAGALQASTDYTDASNKWNSLSNQTIYTKWTANSYTIAFDPNDANYVGTATGTTASINATYDVNYTLTTNGFERAGYTFAGWNSRADGGGTDYTDGQTDISNLTATNGETVTLYAKWTPLTYTVYYNANTHGCCAIPNQSTVTMGATYGESLSESITEGEMPTVAANSGYEFVGWYTAAEGGTKVEKTTQVTTASSHTLYAHYVERTYIYFYNNLGWDYVFVTYDAYWNEDGNGNSNDLGSGNKGKIYHMMSPISEGSYIYYDEVPSSVISSWKYNVCFNSQGLGTIGESSNYNNFNEGKAVFRRDFDSNATMFVPDPTETAVSKNGVQYYSTDQWVDYQDGDKNKPIIDYRYKKGYWMKYNSPTDAGYVIKGTWDGEVNDFYFRHNYGENTYSITKYLPANTTYDFRIYKHCKTSNTYSSWFIGNKDATITSSTDDNPWTITTAIAKSNTTYYDHIRTSIAGDYTFTLHCNTDGTLKLSVKFPGLTVDDNWYRVLYEWNDGSAHSRVCETFRRIANGGNEWVDAFVHKSDAVTSRSMKIQEYVTVSGTPTWRDVNGGTIDLSPVTKNGVYTFVINRKGTGEISGTYREPASSDFYVRSEVTSGGWDNYTSIVGGTQNMTFSDFSAQQEKDPYSHYYCQYIPDTENRSIAFTVGTLFTPSICDTLIGDDIIGDPDDDDKAAVLYKKIPASANVRFMYNENDNTLKRAYLKSAQGSGRDRFLVLHGNDSIYNTDETAVRPGADSLGLHDDEMIFIDKGNWVYEINLKASPVAKVKIIANYNEADRYLIGGPGNTDADWKTILGGDKDDTKYTLAGIYDFKNNRLMMAWKPSGEAIAKKLSDVDMLWVREGDNPAQQINFTGSGSLKNVSVVGAIKFDRTEFVGRVHDWDATTRPKLKYFISFPFDVAVSDIFGFNKAIYGNEYVVQKYNGAKRAKDGLFAGDDGSYWEDLTIDSVMHAGEGYCVIMDNDYLNESYFSIWDNVPLDGAIYLYFPASEKIASISNTTTTSTVKAHQSESERTWTDETGEHKQNETDSHWNLVGSPLFHNTTFTGSGTALNSYYRWHYDNTWKPWVTSGDKGTNAGSSNVLNAMNCILLQWYGTISWSQTESVGPATPATEPYAARRNEEPKNYNLKLELLCNDEAVDWTFIEMREGAQKGFAHCEDMMKIQNYSLPNIYVYAGTNAVAYSQVPRENQIIPVGVIIRQNGSYIFSMPSNFSGTATLVDTFTQTRTNLAFSDYEVTLERGSINNRFYLELNMQEAPTAIDGVEDGSGSLKDGKAHKFIMNDQMYILKDGIIYDARGNRVQ